MREYFLVFVMVLVCIALWTIALERVNEPPPKPVPHDICTLSLGPEPKCVVMSFDGRQRIEDGQVWAYEPDGSVQYMSDVWLVRKCLENCEIGGSF